MAAPAFAKNPLQVAQAPGPAGVSGLAQGASVQHCNGLGGSGNFVVNKNGELLHETIV
jgi:hypothetical protein